MRKSYKILVGKPEGNRPLVRPRRRWEHNSRMDLREIVISLGSDLPENTSHHSYKYQSVYV
jgi:hypothetical protein